jgi:hypothetical protein
VSEVAPYKIRAFAQCATCNRWRNAIWRRSSIVDDDDISMERHGRIYIANGECKACGERRAVRHLEARLELRRHAFVKADAHADRQHHAHLKWLKSHAKPGK